MPGFFVPTTNRKENAPWHSNSLPTTRSASACRGIRATSSRSASRPRSPASTVRCWYSADEQYGRQAASVGQTTRTTGNGHSNGRPNGEGWACSEKQRDLILKLVDEHQLDKGQIEETSHDMFGVGVRELNKLQASGLIERILDEHAGARKTRRPRSSNGAPKRNYANGGAR